jgi:hypothetical protein
MELTTYGYKKAEPGDTGESFFPAINFNWDRLDAHSHDGVDSTLLTISAVAITTQAILAAAWGAVDATTGLYRQTVTLPTVAGAQLDFDEIQISMRLTSTGEIVFPKVVKLTDGTYYVYVNDNSIALTAVYTT